MSQNSIPNVTLLEDECAKLLRDNNVKKLLDKHPIDSIERSWLNLLDCPNSLASQARKQSHPLRFLEEYSQWIKAGCPPFSEWRKQLA